MLTRNLDKAREAYRNKDIDATIKAHNKGYEPHNEGQGKYIKSLVYGGLDGIITTFAVVAGVAGAALNTGIVLIMGFANLIADGLSMAIGDYLSTKAEVEYQQVERERETWEVEHYPEGEMQEMVEIYMAKGMSEEDAKQMMDILSKNKKAWIDVMMVEELGIVEEEESPIRNALVTFFSFLVFGFIPLIAYVLSSFIPDIGDSTFVLAIVLTGVTLFILGALKVKVTERNWFTSGLEMLVVGGIAAVAAYLIGKVLSGLA
ncbi:VIT1/CCC1 transporter family protein [Schnuerera sp. xch1]|uniref:VIT1/CCC1 transporter family protein n=1 Tax=Schnuerera sp. xch1 TaxID=2874283 RepID=UPI001CC11DEC|nr:VIT1/CCC1 transporter family protein [Schnuerera sp. xch1]MBZ2174751.1 VIT1/CCC1 transporter family protein [Schnuerera sp. xch1]